MRAARFQTPPLRWIVAGWLVVAAAWTPASALVNAPNVTPAVLALALAYNLLHFGIWAAATPWLFRLCARFPLGGGDTSRNVLTLALVGVAFVPAITMVVSLIELIVELWRGDGPPTLLAAPGRVASRIMVTSLFALPTYAAVIAIGQTLLWARRAEAHAREAAGAEMRALRAELNPHFLFNTLGAIARLAHAAPERAESAVDTLARVLRASLTDAGPMQTVADALGEIEEHLTLYRTLHGQIRFERRVDDALWAHPLPARLLLPLVENAMTHGAVDDEGERWLRLEVARENEVMVMALENPVPAIASVSSGLGSGLEATRRLLAIHHGEQGRLEYERSDGRFRVVVTLPT